MKRYDADALAWQAIRWANDVVRLQGVYTWREAYDAWWDAWVEQEIA